MKKKAIRKTNEGVFSDLASYSNKMLQNLRKPKDSQGSQGASLGRLARAAIGSFSKKGYGRSVKDQYAANKFIDDFVTRGLEVLNVAVKQGIVDPNEGMTTRSDPSAATPNQPTNPPAQPTAPPSNPNPVQENRYYKVNQLTNLYEGWLNNLYEQTDPNPQPQSPAPPNQQGQQGQENTFTSMAEYFEKAFLDDYLKDIPNSRYMKPKIDYILKNLPELYRTKKLEQALEDLANIAWTLGTGRR